MIYGMILMVNNVQCSLDFYLSLPGFSFELGTAASKEIRFERTEEEFLFAALRVGEQKLMIQTRETLGADVPQLLKIEQLGATGVLYFDVENVDHLYQELKEKNILIVKEINDKFYGRREFYIQDRDGYFLGFSQLIGTHK